MTTTNSINESAIRGRAKRAGYVIRKSREWKHVPNIDNYGQYSLIDAYTNCVVLGARFDASLEQIDDFLSGGDDT
jgi:hypothetical protein